MSTKHRQLQLMHHEQAIDHRCIKCYGFFYIFYVFRDVRLGFLMNRHIGSCIYRIQKTNYEQNI